MQQLPAHQRVSVFCESWDCKLVQLLSLYLQDAQKLLQVVRFHYKITSPIQLILLGRITAHGLCSSDLFCLANIYYERLGRHNTLVYQALINLCPSLFYLLVFLTLIVLIETYRIIIHSAMQIIFSKCYIKLYCQVFSLINQSISSRPHILLLQSTTAHCYLSDEPKRP